MTTPNVGALLLALVALRDSLEGLPPEREAEAATEAARELHKHGVGQVVDFTPSEPLEELDSQVSPKGLPVVMMHGMGDFADNPMGMVPLRRVIAKEANAYVHSVAICNSPERHGNCILEDMSNGFLMTMDNQVEQFARVVKADRKLANGFNAVGMSQGNLVIRGYIQRYNDPPVRSHLSLHGPMMGVAGLPRCPIMQPGLGLICKTVDALADMGVYTDFVQDRLAQSNFYRFPKDLDTYREHGHFLPYINNEVAGKENQTYTQNFKSLDKLVLVMAEDDTVVQPKESEHFGYYRDGSMKELVDMRAAPWYEEDWFGLKSLDEAGKVSHHSTPGDHLRFTEEFLRQMVQQYFNAPAEVDAELLV